MKRLSFVLLLFILFIYGNIMAQGDVDTRIAVNDKSNPNTFVVIIANEHYKYEQAVPFALNDGEVFKLYCEKTLGIPQKNIRYVPDATLNDMRMQILWIEKVMKSYNGEAKAIVYYSGHGMPSEADKQAYLLPIDGQSTITESGMSTAKLYKQLGDMPSAATLVLIDACFSGSQRDGNMLASSRGVAIKAKNDQVSGNMVVFSAAQGNETAYPYREKSHGLFTYYILKQLQEKGGYISLGELSDNVKTLVERTSLIENSKSQTPTIVASASAEKWRNWIWTDTRSKNYEIVQRSLSVSAPIPSEIEKVKNEQTEKENKSVIKESCPIQHIKSVEDGRYWIQVFKGGNTRNDRRKAEVIGSDIRRVFSELDVKVHFYSPLWECRVGRFSTYEDASIVVAKLEELGYHNMTIIKK